MVRRDFLVAASSAVVGGTVGFAARGAASADAAAASTIQAGAPREPAHLIDVATFHSTRQMVQTAHGRIAYVERGAGPAAVFLHGFPLNGFQWRGALERLWPHRRCIALDFMGLGYTEVREGQSLSPAAQTDMLAGFLDALGIDAIDLVANDSGNTVAQLFVVRHPERVRTLLITNGDAHDHSPPPVLAPVIAAAHEGRFADDVLVPQLADPSLALQPTGLGGLAYTDPGFMTRELLEVYTRPLVSSPLRKEWLHRFCIEFEPNPLLPIEHELARCDVPLRIVWGTADPHFPASLAEWLDQTLPNSRGIRWVEGAKLFFPEEMPDVIAAEARRLWGVS